DMLVISDFLWDRLHPDNSELIENARKTGMRIFTLAIGNYGRIPIESDFKYRYENGKIMERNLLAKLTKS
ncbi:MAG: hypothetical protein K2L11_04600, partial [Muribaculaceae bacterium]|nr:hypothetical protein [Muribaculaceae bacterium]